MITAKKKSLLFCKELEGIFCIIYTAYCILYTQVPHGEEIYTI